VTRSTGDVDPRTSAFAALAQVVGDQVGRDGLVDVLVHCGLVATLLRCEIFPSDLDATADFYVRVLGFAVERDDRDAENPYLALRLDGVRIGAAQRPEVNRAARRPPTGVELVIEVDDLDRLHDRVVDAGWPIEDEMTNQPWGLRDFRVIDPSGYYLRLTER
jgi:lactoylglutathione lyase